MFIFALNGKAYHARGMRGMSASRLLGGLFKQRENSFDLSATSLG